MRGTEEQRAVIEAPIEGDLLVVAGAGSGKTMTMTMRIIHLIKEGVAPERILGLTFTRKAASELLSRVSAAVLDQDGENASDADYGFLKPEVYTYDAFFQSIVRRYGLLVGMDQQTQPLSEAGAYQLAALVVHENLDRLFMTPGALPTTSFDTIVGQILSLAHACTNAMISEDCPSFDEAAARVSAWDEAFIDSLRAAIDGEDIPEKELTASALGMPRRNKKDSESDYVEKLRQMRDRQHLQELFDANRLLQVAGQREVLLDLARQYEEAKRAANMAEFSDFTLAAFQLVTRFPSIGAHYRQRFSHVFLDEYQDTSTTQAMLLAALFHIDGPRSDRHQSADGRQTQGQKVQGQRGSYGRTSVTAVGDPFQSIYAWRGASPGAFRTFQQQFGQRQEAASLSATFRNPRIVLEAANALTRDLREDSGSLSSASMREVDVLKLRPRDGADEGTLGLLGYRTLAQEIDGVLRFAKHAIARHASSGDGRGGADTSAPHVAVLFRAKSTMPQYRDALLAAGLSCEVVGYSALLDKPEIMDALAVLHVISDHTDSGSLMRLLASARFNIAPKDLNALARMCERLNTEHQYRALVEAGVVPGGLRASAMSRAVVAHRDLVPDGVFLTDVLLDDHCAETLAKPRARASFTETGRKLLLRASEVLRRAQAESTTGLRQAVRGAVQALDLDIDVVLAHALHHPDEALQPSESTAALGALYDLADGFIADLPAGSVASLPAFVSWIDSMKKSPDEPATGADSHADVVLMTIHQAKGLEWDAVALVGLQAGSFPSSQGDGLSVTCVDPKGSQEGLRRYEQTAHTWLTDPTAVPVPVRADAMILPRFPHDAAIGADPISSLRTLNIHTVVDEAFGTLRAYPRYDEEDAGDAEADIDVRTEGGDPGYLTQEQEYGARLLADERRLAYVALTRAKHDILLTFAETPSDPRVALDDQQVDPESKASNFWLELWDLFRGRSGCVPAGADRTLEAGDAQPPSGVFVGADAEAYESAVVHAAQHDAPSLSAERPQVNRWPVVLDRSLSWILERSATLLRDARESDDGAVDSLPADASLLAQAVRVVQSNAGRFGGPAIDPDDISALRELGGRILMHGTQNVTAIQARTGALSEEREHRYWQGIVRPVPRVSSPSAQAGTVFHAWASQFLIPSFDAEGSVPVDDGPMPDVELIRQSMLQQPEPATDILPSEQSAKLHLWQQRLAQSHWAHRPVRWVERPIVAYLGDSVVNGKLDAVFEGGLDPSDPAKRFTVVDWKTGRRPSDGPESDQKLLQLEIYRLLLSVIENIELDTIDACLYYLSEAGAERAEIPVKGMTREEIMDIVTVGVPEASDND
ncbi:MAG: UvrD-helicase domain-containing protein [Bifidobacterium psychraerophilum]|uniref:ATP-dependent helicase n=1 Tax=Bifidobacterium psychraerophilum TaxID=218140 RepID=UPI0039ED6758